MNNLLCLKNNRRQLYIIFVTENDIVINIIGNRDELLSIIALKREQGYLIDNQVLKVDLLDNPEIDLQLFESKNYVE